MRPFAELQTRIAAETSVQPHLNAIRGYNHTMVQELGKCTALAGKQMLDLGGSVHGFALEAALGQGVSLYEGIDFDIARHWQLPEVAFRTDSDQVGRLRQMNAEQLDFPDASFDCLLTISTFEHFARPDAVLAEMHRVLRPGGVALVSFEPIWTSPGGHHLHHFGEINGLAPLWSHLYLSETQMRDVLARQAWPATAPIDLEGALRWIYHDPDINRFGVRELLCFFQQSPFEVVWTCPLRDEVSTEVQAVADYLSKVLPLTSDELLTRGLSLLLRK